MPRTASLYLVLMLFASLLLPPAHACRIILPPYPPYWPPPIEPPPPPQRPWQEMEVRAHRVNIELTDHVARVSVAATFYNPNGQRIEGTYVFPIAREAAVSSFSMTVNGKTLEAELLPAEKARAIYEGIVRSQRDPALLEYLEQGLLQARVFPIEPRSEVKIELSYDHRVPRDGDLARLVYPLLSARPGGGQSLQSVLVDVTVKTAQPLKTLYTPGFESRVDRRSDGSARLTWEAHNYLPTKDFEIVYSANKGPVGVDFLSYRKGDDGYFLLFVSPASELQAQEIAAKDITFVVDTSGSMHGQKIVQARKALAFCVDNLRESDRFNLIAFSTDVLPMAETSLPVNATTRAQAREFIDRLQARGGTAIDDALAAALKAPPAKGAVPMLVFLTDGLPTIGEVDPAAILKRVQAAAGPRRIFTFGVGDDVNTKLLDGIASTSRGFTTYVRPSEDLELALSGFYTKVASPVMTDLKLETDLKLRELIPSQLPDLFRGGQVVVAGRYTGSGKSALTVTGEVGGKREKFRLDVDLAGDPRNAFVPRLWAIRRVGFLEEQLRLHGQNQELVDEIRRLGREFGILTPYTSFLVVEEGLAVREREDARRQMMELPAPTTAPASGARAVQDAIGYQARKGALGFSDAAPAAAAPEVVEEMEAHGIADAERKVREALTLAGDKTFYRRADDGYLYDSAIPAGSTPKVDREVAAYSAEFFALAAKYPQLRQYLLAGTRLVLVLDGQTIRITDPAPVK